MDPKRVPRLRARHRPLGRRRASRAGGARSIGCPGRKLIFTNGPVPAPLRPRSGGTTGGRASHLASGGIRMRALMAGGIGG